MEEKKLSQADFLRKLSKCKTVEEALKVAEEEEVKLTEKEAADLLEKLNMQSKELSDEEMEAVAGGYSNDADVIDIEWGYDSKGRITRYWQTSGRVWGVNCPKCNRECYSKGDTGIWYCDHCNTWWYAFCWRQVTYTKGRWSK